MWGCPPPCELHFHLFKPSRGCIGSGAHEMAHFPSLLSSAPSGSSRKQVEKTLNFFLVIYNNSAVTILLRNGFKNMQTGVSQLVGRGMKYFLKYVDFTRKCWIFIYRPGGRHGTVDRHIPTRGGWLVGCVSLSAEVSDCTKRRLRARPENNKCSEKWAVGVLNAVIKKN